MLIILMVGYTSLPVLSAIYGRSDPGSQGTRVHKTSSKYL